MAPRRRPARPGALADLSPLRILTQITVLQLCYYGAAVVLIVFTALVAGQHADAGLLLDWRNVRGDVTTGWTLGLCWGLVAGITVVPILLLIARSKLVPDFAATVHLIHLFATSLYSHAIPASFYWWLVQFCSLAVMTSLGMWACRWRELKPMPFGGKSSKGKEPVEPGSVEEGVGFEMGRGGRGGDGQGAYEMVGMAAREGG